MSNAYRVEHEGARFRLLADGIERFALDAPKPAGRHSLARLPDGRNVLFASVPSYMDVRVVDCASGEVLGSYDHRSGGDFCHVEYLVCGDYVAAFGCVWACPYEVRLYELEALLTPRITALAPVASVAPRFEDELVLPPVSCEIAGEVRVARYLRHPWCLPEEVADFEEDATPGVRALHRQLQALSKTPAAVIVSDIACLGPEPGRIVWEPRVGAALSAQESEIRVHPDGSVTIRGEQVVAPARAGAGA